MPQFDSDPILSLRYTSAAAGNVYSFDGLSLIDALTDASQIEVRWDVDFVWSAVNNSGTRYTVDDLDPQIAEEIKTLVLDTQYTINAETNEVTLVLAAIENQPITTSAGTVYFYPQTLTVSSSQYIELRRSTDVTTRVVVFQPGSRLTAESLNLANSQVFNAIQELTEFGMGGTGGTISDIDLSGSSINDLGDVNINTSVDGLLKWDVGTGTVISGADSGGLVPAEGGTDTDKMVLMSTYTVSGPNASPSYDWDFVTYDEVFATKAGSTTLATKLGLTDGRLDSLESDTSDISRPTIPGPTVFGTDDVSISAGDLTVFTGLIDVKSSDVLIQGESVYDYITHEPYFWQLPNGDSSNITGSTGTRTLGNQTEFASHTAFQYSSSTASADFNFTSGVWTAPRDMVVSVSLTWSLTIQGGGATGSSLGRIFHNGTNVGGPIYNNNDNNTLRRSATKAVVLNVSAGDTITCVVERDGGNTFNVENAEACLHEVR